jgi:hypothetical protein
MIEVKPEIYIGLGFILEQVFDGLKIKDKEIFKPDDLLYFIKQIKTSIIKFYGVYPVDI